MKDEAVSPGVDFRKCIAFHGHTCPGLAIGFRAARTLMERLGAREVPDEEFVAIVESDACGADAIQVMTGCTFGKGNFLFKNYGKHAFSMVDRRKGKGIRVCLRSDVFRMDPEFLSIFQKVHKKGAPAKDMERYKQLQHERVQEILNADTECLFKIEEFSPRIPPKARIMESGICDVCGESTQVSLLGTVDGRKTCLPCAETLGFANGLSAISSLPK